MQQKESDGDVDDVDQKQQKESDGDDVDVDQITLTENTILRLHYRCSRPLGAPVT